MDDLTRYRRLRTRGFRFRERPGTFRGGAVWDENGIVAFLPRGRLPHGWSTDQPAVDPDDWMEKARRHQEQLRRRTER